MSSSTIMERMRSAAQQSARSAVRLGTLVRIETACDDIASGDAIKFAQRAKMDALPFKSTPPRINSLTVDHYVKVRRRIDGAVDWPGPTASTIRSDTDLMNYLAARQAEIRGPIRPRKRSPRARRIVDILSDIKTMEDRAIIMEALEDGYAATTRYQIAKAMVRELAGVNLDDMLKKSEGSPNQYPSRIEVSGPLPTKSRQTIKRLLARFYDDQWTKRFGLVFDGKRVKLAFPPGSTLIEMEEIEVLNDLADSKNVSDER